jgi:hypothetical protein
VTPGENPSTKSEIQENQKKVARAQGTVIGPDISDNAFSAIADMPGGDSAFYDPVDANTIDPDVGARDAALMETSLDDP